MVVSEVRSRNLLQRWFKHHRGSKTSASQERPSSDGVGMSVLPEVAGSSAAAASAAATMNANTDVLLRALGKVKVGYSDDPLNLRVMLLMQDEWSNSAAAPAPAAGSRNNNGVVRRINESLTHHCNGARSCGFDTRPDGFDDVEDDYGNTLDDDCNEYPQSPLLAPTSTGRSADGTKHKGLDSQLLNRRATGRVVLRRNRLAVL